MGSFPALPSNASAFGGRVFVTLTHGYDPAGKSWIKLFFTKKLVHFENVLPSQSLGVVLKKLNL